MCEYCKFYTKNENNLKDHKNAENPDPYIESRWIGIRKKKYESAVLHSRKYKFGVSKSTILDHSF